MSTKISIDEVEVILAKKLEKQIVASIIKEMTEVAEEIKADANSQKLPKQKNEFLIILSDPENKLAGQELTGWVVTKQENVDSATVLDKIRAAARDTNQAKKRKKHMLETLGDAFAGIKRKFLPKSILIKTKLPVRVLVTDNKI